MSPARTEVVRWALRAGVLAGTAAATTVVRRRAARRAEPSVDRRDEPGLLGGLHTEAVVVLTEDGVPLCVEIEPGPPDLDGPTIVFLAGFCLNMDAWHFQREDLRGVVRCVFYDHRGHGRSGRGDRDRATIEQLARDLRAVLDAVVGDGPVVLVGHSLGGMTVMAFAEAFGAEFGKRVVGAALIATSSGKLAEATLGLPAAVVRRLWKYSPGVVDLVSNRPILINRGIGADRDVGLFITKRLSFGRRDVDPEVAQFAGDLLNSTPLDVFGEFFPEFHRHDKEAALPVFRECQTLIVAGARDVLTPPDHSRGMAMQVPEAELMVLEEAGHLVLLEQPDEVNAAIRRLLERVRLATQRPSVGHQRRAAR
ncbi:MAG: alpha/beta fold hydrolase [Sporichthyaceae bacterium]